MAEIEGKLTENSDDAELDKNLADPKQKQEQVVKAFEEARKRFTEAPLTTYSPLTPMYPQQSTGRRTALAQTLGMRLTFTRPFCINLGLIPALLICPNAAG